MSDFVDGNDYGGSESSSPKYSMHPTFSGAYYNDIAKPEDYYTNITILNDIMNAFSKFIEQHEKYGYLRIIDISKIKKGDKVSVVGLDDEYEILDMDGDTIIINHDGNPAHIEKQNIRLIDDCLSKLKRTDISFIYTEVNKITNNDHYSCIEFFSIFSEYFKINEKTLYSSLPRILQLELTDSLKKRLDIAIIDPENQLPKGKKIIITRGEYQSCGNPHEYHVFNVDMYGEVVEFIRNDERSKWRLKVRIETETKEGEVDIDIITRLSRIKFLDEQSIDLIW